MLTITSMYELLPDVYKTGNKLQCCLEHADLLRQACFKDYSNCKKSGRIVGGVTPKEVIICNGEELMLKFAKVQEPFPSINDFLCEYLSSNMARALGYSAHTVDLGYFNDQ
ncbi:MAG: hypothetical protein NC548_10880 [Lachnospiraceae bacterium]|nr:hypothetical protein [Lachnospiraceae bacterium]